MRTITISAKVWKPLITAAAALSAACTDRYPASPEAVEATVAEARQAADPQEIQGQIGPGALYSLSIPANWNGDLVVFAHGWDFPSNPVAVPDIAPFRDGLYARGYGLAVSSFSENGFAVQDGVLRTRQVRDLFISKFGQPRRTYLSSGSMGAQIIMRLAQENPRHYDGVLPMCGPMGGSRMEIDYLMNVRVLFDYFYPGVIPGDAVHVPAGLDFNTDVVPAAVEAILANPAAAIELAGVNQVDIHYADFGELVESILTGLFFNTLPDFMDDLRARTHGHDYFDNTQVVYTGSGDDAALNAGVDRFAAAPDALEFLRHWYQPDGELTMPVLTVHTTRDPVVPRLHDTAFEAAVAAAGRSDLLVQRFVDVFGHCSEDWADDLTAFDDLRTWVETGVKPTP
jgi:pimeloyl-ACP methyl ester carboxylesterase